jgi:hypothetical protein
VPAISRRQQQQQLDRWFAGMKVNRNSFDEPSGLDIRLGRTYAHPWETKNTAPVHGWIDENGDIIPFDS